jgi:hypothetical protein
MTSKDHQLDRTILWVLIGIEALLFYAYYAREVAPYPPQNFDQAVYLSEAYSLETRTHEHGISELWRAIWSKNHFSSLLLPIEGAVFGLMLGGQRLPQLCVLFVGFCALQFFAFATARKIWGHRSYGLMVLGLILAQNSLWHWAGGLFDFRIDFLAYCLYGIWVCAVVRSDFFFHRRWAIGSGLIGAFLVFNRFLSVIYVIGVSIGFAVACAIILSWFRNDIEIRRRIRQRLINLALSLGTFIIVVTPIFLINWHSIYAKYVYGQFIYEKDIRAREFGIVDLGGHLLYYPRSILWDHFGPAFLSAAALGIAGALIARLLARSAGLAKLATQRSRETVWLEIVFLLGAIIGPVIVLTIDISKSPVIGGIVGVPAALLVVSLVAQVVPSAGASESSPAHKIVLVVSLAIFAIGLYHLFDKASRHAPEYAVHRNLKHCTELDKWLVEFATKHGWYRPRISVDVISGWFNAGAMTASGYEQVGELVEFQPELGNGADVMGGLTLSQALSSLANSDFVILTTLPKTGVYPFYQEISQYWDDLKAWADKNLFVAKTIQFDGFNVTVYVRPKPAILGTLNGWITRDGFSIEASRAELERFPVVLLAGPANFSWLPKTPAVSAAIETEKDPLAVHASLRRTDGGYEIQIDTPSDLPPGDPIRLHITFDTFFIPKNLGVSPDTRELVVPAPSLVQLLHRESGLNDSSR